MARYRVKKGDVELLNFEIGSFSGNCGYRIMHGDNAYMSYKSLSEADKRQVDRIVYHKLCTLRDFFYIRMIVLSEVTEKNRWLYSFMKNNNLHISKPVKVNTNDRTPSKTALSYFSPYLNKDRKAPRKIPNSTIKLDDISITTNSW